MPILGWKTFLGLTFNISWTADFVTLHDVTCTASRDYILPAVKNKQCLLFPSLLLSLPTDEGRSLTIQWSLGCCRVSWQGSFTQINLYKINKKLSLICLLLNHTSEKKFSQHSSVSEHLSIPCLRKPMDPFNIASCLDTSALSTNMWPWCLKLATIIPTVVRIAN